MDLDPSPVAINRKRNSFRSTSRPSTFLDSGIRRITVEFSADSRKESKESARLRNFSARQPDHIGNCVNHRDRTERGREDDAVRG